MSLQQFSILDICMDLGYAVTLMTLNAFADTCKLF